MIFAFDSRMRIEIETHVEQSALEVWEGFTKELFEALSPPFPKATLLQYDGNQKGDIVAIELNFLLFKNKWVSLISDNQTTETGYFFIDEGKELPFFLSKWKHKHIINKSGEGAAIIDQIEFKSPLGWLMYPFIYLQFLQRKPLYKKIFSKN